MLTTARAAAIAALAVAACGRDAGTPDRTERRAAGETVEPTAGRTIDPAPVGPRDTALLILDLAASYPDGGGYAWPAPAGTHGTTRDLFVDGERIAVAGDRGSHCVGLTFEVFWRALESAGGPAAAGLDAEGARAMLREWFVPRERGRGPADALPLARLGVVVDDLEDARPGDFVQVWFNNGRGHAMIFYAWVRDASGAITGIDFWSSQPWTDGIGRSVRDIGDGPRDIDRDAIYIARAHLPGAAPTTSE